MANKALSYQESMFASMILELNSQSAQHAKMQQELEIVRHQLDQASKTLAHKDQIIGSLENDLEHMIDQLLKIQKSRESNSQQWMGRSVPGLNHDAALA